MTSGHRLGELARRVGGRVEGDPDRRIARLATLEQAGPDDLSFVTSPEYGRRAAASGAGALLAGAPVPGYAGDLLLADDPSYALALLLEQLYPEDERPTGVHPTAVVAEDAEVHPSVAIGPHSVVGAGSSIDAGAVLHAHVVLGRRCSVGAGSELHPHVTLYDGTRVGERCILHSGVVLGGDGFGYATQGREHRKLRHVGRVVVEDDVEIGANCTVDRAMLSETRIGAGSKFDNMVHVGHNVRVGRGALLVAQVGIAGSTRLGDGVVIGGQTGVAGHLTLGDGVQVGSKSAVYRTVEPGARVAGIPATEMAAWRRQQALTARLPELLRRLRAVERRLEDDRKEDERER